MSDPPGLPPANVAPAPPTVALPASRQIGLADQFDLDTFYLVLVGAGLALAGVGHLIPRIRTEVAMELKEIVKAQWDRLLAAALTLLGLLSLLLGYLGVSDATLPAARFRM